MERTPFFGVIKILLVHSFIISLVTGAVAAAAAAGTDQQALLALKAHITHDPSNRLSKNWTSNASVCYWMGVTCSINHHRVTALNLSNLNLTGTVPSQLGNLSSLQTLDLSYNLFSGTIPSSIFGIFTLKSLFLSDNQLSGSLPIFSNISSLQVIDLNYNSLSGELPANICNHLPYLHILLLSVNMFDGEIPPTVSNCKHLQMLSLSYNGFSGAIPKQVGNLTKLKELYLGFNNLQGEIQRELGNLAELELISLTNNLLTGSIPSSIFNISSLRGLDFSNNSFTGSLPDGVCRNLPRLEGLYLINNQLSGPIPQNLAHCTELTFVSLSYNQFSGRIPRDIGNMTLLNELYLDDNNLMGELPHEIANLRHLEVLSLKQNNLIGVVPAAIFNLSTIRALSLFNNTLRGTLPSSTDIRLPNLEEFNLGMNNFSGSIPSFILNASKLSLLELGENSFSGFFPSTFGNLRNLEWLRLTDSNLKSSTPELSFLSSLTNCKNLKVIDLGGNPLDGTLPDSIGNLPISLEMILLSNCRISGKIPEKIGNLRNLINLELDANKFTGSIPVTVGKLQKLQRLTLRNNQLEGSIPNDLCRLPRLFQLSLDGNKLSGSIPACLGNLTTLRKLSLGSNKLSSVIPLTFWNLKDCLFFNLSSNSLTGTLPLDIGNFKVAVQIDLSRNNLSGDIPTSIGSLRDLDFLSLAYNKLQGSIPKSFGDLKNLNSMNLSNNNLSGGIPTSLEKLSNLKYLNLSFNRLEGEIPRGGSFENFSAESFLGNNLLCGSPNLQVPPCKYSKTSSRRISRKNVLLIGIVLPLNAALLVVVILALRFVLNRRSRKRSLPSEDNLSLQATRRRFSHLELLRATDGFNENNLIGTGSFGSVYKARLQDGMEVAVKVFHLQCEGAFKSFDAECEVLKSIRHRNLIKIISSCSNEDFKALVLEYMPNGNLEECLYSHECTLDIFQRLDIMIDVGSALEYLHFGHSTPVVHCDLKPNNVLLDENMVAHLSDFGIAKLLSGEDQSMTHTQTIATIGYMAPEYGRDGKVSTKGDVYSYGIVLMETFTRKNPTDEMFSEETSLKHWVNGSLERFSLIEVVDAYLLSAEDEHFAAKEQCLFSILGLAVECAMESPLERINTKEIVTRLLKIRGTLLKSIGTGGVPGESVQRLVLEGKA